MSRQLCITSTPEEMDQGLFGMVFYYLLQVLPYLDAHNIFPRWEIRTRHYADPPDYLTVPGVVDLAYQPPRGPCRTISLSEMRRRHAHVLGNDWAELHRIWSRYFKVPARVLAEADAVFPQGRVFGVHYRGTDKQANAWDSNPISPEQYLLLVREFLKRKESEFDVIFAATDEHSFVEQLRRATGREVISLGEVEFHMAEEHSTTRAAKADRALLDCVLLSRCQFAMETSSALPSFAKLLNPELEIYRTAASKLFGKLYTKMPYFPVAHIPVFPAEWPESRAILSRTMVADWTGEEETRRYQRSFAASPRWPINHAVFTLAERVGMDYAAQRLVRWFC